MGNTQNRPITTLFLIASLDGKITTGDNDALDVDKDFKRIVGVGEGLHQYYELEGQTDLFSLNSGRVMAKIGVNERAEEPTKMDVSFVIIDNRPHLTEEGVEYLAKWVKRLYLVTTNRSHPVYAVSLRYPNIEIVLYEDQVDLRDLLERLKGVYGVNRLTIQSGGTLNAGWLRESLIDHVSIVLAPCLVGGEDTQGVIGGESLHSQEDLWKIRALKLVRCDVLENSYVYLRYDVINETQFVQ